MTVGARNPMVKDVILDPTVANSCNLPFSLGNSPLHPRMWVNREQQELNGYLRTENNVVKEYIGRNASCSPTTSVDDSLSKVIDPTEEVGQIAGKIEHRERWGGLLRYYHRDAA